jgi:putative membrane protein
MMDGLGGMGIFGGFGMVAGLLFWAGVLAFLVWALVAAFPNGRGESRNPETALDILRKRYAAGEISQGEFEQARRALV